MSQPLSFVLLAASFHAAGGYALSGLVDREYWTGTSWNSVAGADVTIQGTAATGTTFEANGLQTTSWVTESQIQNFGQRARGFLVPLQTGSYTFWISADDWGEFWLSSDSTEGNAVKIANMEEPNGCCGTWLDFSKSAEQKSSPVSLVAGSAYYLEILHMQETSTAHVAIFWNTDPNHSPTPADIVPISVLYPFSRGVAAALSGDTSVAARLDRDYWSGVSAGGISSLTGDARYPGNPTGSDLVILGGLLPEPATKWGAYSFIQRIQGFIVPETSGDYRFYINADDLGSFRLSTDEDPGNKQEICHAPHVAPGEFSYEATEEKSSPQTLEAGRVYYFEIVHVNGASAGYVNIAWRTDDTLPTQSDIVPASVLHPYSQGVPTSTTTSSSSTSTISSTSTSTSTMSSTSSSSSSSSISSTSTSSTSATTTSTSTLTMTATTSSSSSSTTTRTATSTSSSSTTTVTTSMTSTVTTSSTVTSTSSTTRSSTWTSSTTTSSTVSTPTSTTRTATSSTSTSTTRTSSASSTTTSATSTSSSTTSATGTGTSSTATSATSTSSSTTSATGTGTSSTVTSATGTSSAVTSSTSTSSSTTSITGSSTTLSSPNPKVLTPNVQNATELLDAITSSANDLVAGLSESNETNRSTSVPGGTIVVFRLRSIIMPERRVEVKIPDAGIDISMPSSLLDLFEARGLATDDIIFAVHTTNFTAEVLDAEGVIYLQFFSNELPFEVGGLDEPIEFTLSANFTERDGRRSSCVFWNETLRRWSEEGVTTSSEINIGDSIVCLTKHLSLFGSILKGIASAVLCSQLSLLNLEAMANLFKGRWYVEHGAVMYWCILAGCLVALVAATAMDTRRTKSGHHRNADFFLHEDAPLMTVNKDEDQKNRPSQGSSSSDHPSEGPERAPTAWLRWAVCCIPSCIVAVCYAACACFRDMGARDALDEICSAWCEQFGEVRDILETLWGALELEALTGGRLLHLSTSVVVRLARASVRRSAGVALGYTDETVAFVLHDEDLLALLMRRHHKKTALVNQDDLGTGQSAELTPRWWRVAEHEEAWYGLHQEIMEQVESRTHAVESHSICQVLRFFLAHNPLLGLFLFHDVFFSCRMRWLFYVLEVNSSLLLTCLFFQTSGSTTPKGLGAGCGGETEDAGFLIGRALVVSLAAVLLGGLPVTFFQSLHTRSLKCFPSSSCPEWKRQLRAWNFEDGLVWTLGTLYLGFSTLFVLLFLSNISDEDHADFVQTGLTCLLQNLVVLPLAAALTLPTITSLLFLTLVAVTGDRASLVRSIRLHLYSETNMMLPVQSV